MKIFQLVKLFVFGAMIASAGTSAIAQKTNNRPVPVPVFRKDTFNIKNYGAVADGVFLNSASINKAIEACSKKGGGVVLVPTGLWLTGPIELKSNVNLHLQRNAVLLFTPDLNEYKLVETNWEGLRAVRNQSPVWATNAQNIAITGSGIIDGNGDAWRMVKREKMTETNWNKLLAKGGFLSDDKKTWYPTEQSLRGSKTANPGVLKPGLTVADMEPIKDFLRPNLLVLTRCKGILLDGVTFQNSPAWCLHPLMSQQITIRNIYVKNPWYAQNGDGIDLESCSNVLLENSVFDVGDDGICIKSGRDEQGRQRGMPTQDVVVRNCTVYHAHGGFVIGSEMSGGARNISVQDCSFIGTDIGLRFKTTRGRGGVVENIAIKNITMKDIVAEAILFDMYYAAKDPVPLAGEKREPPKVETLPVNETTPIFRNIHINNVACHGAAKALFVRGLPEMNVQNVVMENMTLQANEGVDMTEGTNLVLKNVRLLTKNTNPIMNIHNSKNIVLDNIGYKHNSEVLLALTGNKLSGIRLINTNAANAKQKVTFDYGAPQTAFTEK